MYREHQYDEPMGEVEPATARHTLFICVVIALELAIAIGLSATLTGGHAETTARPFTGGVSGAAPDLSRFILNALLVPALDGDALPLRWVDPRPVLGCGPNTFVRVNHEPLVAGALVPDMPFELEWQADGCSPFGVRQPRLDGAVKLMVFREDWGFSAMVEPSDLRVTSAQNETTWIRRGVTRMPQAVDVDDSVMMMPVSADRL